MVILWFEVNILIIRYKASLSLSTLEDWAFCLPKMETVKVLMVIILPQGELRWISGQTLYQIRQKVQIICSLLVSKQIQLHPN